MDIKEIIADHLIDSGYKIKNGECGMNDEELQSLASSLMHIEMKKSEAAEFLGISPRTFDRRVSAGEIPQGVHEIHHKELIWYKDELCKIKESL